jgi:hypothetical protein
MLCLHYTLCLMQLSVVRNLILMGCSNDISGSGLLVIDAVGWRSMYFVVMPRLNRIVIFLTYHVYLYSINCPTVICLPSLCYLSYGEAPLVNCGPRSYFHHIGITRLFYSHCLLYSHISLDTLIPFVSSKPVRLTTSSQVGNKVLGCVVCRFHVATGWRRVNKCRKWRPCWSVIKPVRITFSRIVCSSPDRHTLVSYWGKRLAAVLIRLSAWSFPTAWPQ